MKRIIIGLMLAGMLAACSSKKGMMMHMTDSTAEVQHQSIVLNT